MHGQQNIKFAYSSLDTTVKLCFVIYLLYHCVHPAEVCIVLYCIVLYCTLVLAKATEIISLATETILSVLKVSYARM
jgi:hypothetical protein